MSASIALARASGPAGLGARLKSDLDLGNVWPAFLVWLAVSVCTLGLGWLVVSGHFFKLVINTTTIVDAHGRIVGRLHCDYDVEARVGHIALWILVCIITLGVGLLYYSFHAARSALDATSVEWV